MSGEGMADSGGRGGRRALLAVAALLGALLVPAAAGGTAERSVHLVEIARPPALGDRLEAASIDAATEAALAGAGLSAGRAVYRYQHALAGAAVALTPEEAARLRTVPGVLAVTPDEVRRPAAEDRPEKKNKKAPAGRESTDFLGLPDGLWKQLGGPERAGAGVVVGVIDSGISPEHPSFAAAPKGPGGQRLYQGPAFPPPRGWRGACASGEKFPVTTCNNKLVGARFYVEGFGRDRLSPDEFLSARDASGHGTHTAATAAGNYGVRPATAGHDLGIPMVSGVAPRAHLAAYKVCWTGKAAQGGPAESDGCTNSDTVAAIDAAVADGVDVINYSVGATTSTVSGPVERAFLGATEAGVFVAASAGNGGPRLGSVGSPAAVPWITAVGATSIGRSIVAGLTVTPKDSSAGPPAAVSGQSLTGDLKRTPIVLAAAVAAATASEQDALLCRPGSLDPARVKGKVVLCRRGDNPRLEKGKVVADAGGAGMVLANGAPDEDTQADPHYLPAIHVTQPDGDRIRALLEAGVAATAEITGGRAVPGRADILARFSSRGPQSAVPDILKPDVVAPGVDILAADTPSPAGPAERKGERFGVKSGTSMAAPHVAGLAALLTQADSRRSPAALRSALMTTAVTKVYGSDGASPAGPLEMGAGRIDPSRAAAPGLVLEVPPADYRRYVAGQLPRQAADGVSPLPAVDLNLPSVSFGALAGAAATRRTVTSVEAGPTSWKVAVEGMAGVDTTVTPGFFDIAPGQSQDLEVRARTGAAPLGVPVAGALVLTSGEGRTARLPLWAVPVKVAAPRSIEVVTEDAAGRQAVPVRAGFQGDLSGAGWGLAEPQRQPGQKVGAGRDAPPAEPSAGVTVFDVEVPPGAQLLAGRSSNADGGAPDTDLDLLLFHDRAGDGFDLADKVAESADGDADEAIALVRPAPGRYRFSVVGFKTAEPYTVFDFTTWLAADPVPDEGGLAVRGDPRPVRPGETVSLGLEWSGAGPEGIYLGLATFSEGAAPGRAEAVSLVRLHKAARGSAPPGWPDGAWEGPAASYARE